VELRSTAGAPPLRTTCLGQDSNPHLPIHWGALPLELPDWRPARIALHPLNVTVPIHWHGPLLLGVERATTVTMAGVEPATSLHASALCRQCFMVVWSNAASQPCEVGHGGSLRWSSVNAALRAINLWACSTPTSKEVRPRGDSNPTLAPCSPCPPAGVLGSRAPYTFGLLPRLGMRPLRLYRVPPAGFEPAPSPPDWGAHSIEHQRPGGRR
jgi:hypothetical protein